MVRHLGQGGGRGTGGGWGFEWYREFAAVRHGGQGWRVEGTGGGRVGRYRRLLRCVTVRWEGRVTGRVWMVPYRLLEDLSQLAFMYCKKESLISTGCSLLYLLGIYCNKYYITDL